MNKKTFSDDIEIPQWDVALESLVRDEYANKGALLQIADFKRLATQHTIRFDDIMDTVFKLCIHGAWSYEDENGIKQRITQSTVNKLYVNARLHEKDLTEFKGGWRPAKQAS